MDKHTDTSTGDPGTLAEDARALLEATADIAGEHIEQARARLTARLDSSGNFIERLRTKTIGRAKTADAAVRKRPYQAIGVSFGLGVITGCLLACRYSRGCD